MIFHDITHLWCYQVLLMKQNLIICFYNRLQQFGVKSMATIPNFQTWYYVTGGHFIRLFKRLQCGQRSKGEPSIHLMIRWAHRICVGETIRSKEPPWVSCPDISEGDIPRNKQGKGLGAWPLCLKSILGYVLLGFILKIDATKA